MNISEKYEEGPPMHLFVDGQDTGVIDWEISGNAEHGYVDYLEAEAVLKERHLRKIAQSVIANCLHSMYPSLETVDFPNSRQEVLKNAA